MTVAKVPGVFRASGINGQFSGGSFPIILFIVPNGGGSNSVALDSVLINLILSTLSDYRMAGKRIRPTNPTYVTLLFNIDALVLPSYQKIVAQAAIQTFMSSKYGLDNSDFAEVIDLRTLTIRRQTL